ncbi:uncharacterized protein TNCV_46681 [Trichonephila clavipes]|nr:uncharacterized protein TNCV_46681 [Trichonephila clavipes]
MAAKLFKAGRRHAYANKETWNQSEYGAVVGKAYIKQRVSGTVIRLVTAATVAGYRDLSEFERGVIADSREMGHSISEVAMKFGFSCTIISRVYCENIGNPVKHQIFDIAATGKRTCKNGTNDERESLSVTDVQPFHKLMLILMLGHQHVSQCEASKETSSIWAFGTKSSLVYTY